MYVVDLGCVVFGLLFDSVVVYIELLFDVWCEWLVDDVLIDCVVCKVCFGIVLFGLVVM